MVWLLSWLVCFPRWLRIYVCLHCKTISTDECRRIWNDFSSLLSYNSKALFLFYFCFHWNRKLIPLFHFLLEPSFYLDTVANRVWQKAMFDLQSNTLRVRRTLDISWNPAFCMWGIRPLEKGNDLPGALQLLSGRSACRIQASWLTQ